VNKKYAIWPGWVGSKNDKDKHYISAGQLMKLYRVDPRECVVLTEYDLRLSDNHIRNKTRGLTILGTRYDGDYSHRQPRDDWQR
jgi:hypothetical protein